MVTVTNIFLKTWQMDGFSIFNFYICLNYRIVVSLDRLNNDGE